MDGMASRGNAEQALGARQVQFADLEDKQFYSQGYEL